MSNKKPLTVQINFNEYDSVNDLTKEDQELIQKAREISRSAYAPYSNFKVGAALKLNNGQVITGTNQENAAYPSGTCAERTAFFYASTQFPNMVFETIAISAESDHFLVDSPIPPCGSCRQAMVEYEKKQKKNIRVLFTGQTGKVRELSSISDLLPLTFDGTFLK